LNEFNGGLLSRLSVTMTNVNKLLEPKPITIEWIKPVNGLKKLLCLIF